jgi:hypothetical protein
LAVSQCIYVRSNQRKSLAGAFLDVYKTGHVSRIEVTGRLILEFPAHLAETALEQPAALDDGSVYGRGFLSDPAGLFLFTRDQLASHRQFVPCPLALGFSSFQSCEASAQLLYLNLSLGLRFDQGSAPVFQPDDLGLRTGPTPLQSIEGVGSTRDPGLDRFERFKRPALIFA